MTCSVGQNIWTVWFAKEARSYNYTVKEKGCFMWSDSENIRATKESKGD